MVNVHCSCVEAGFFRLLAVLLEVLSSSSGLKVISEGVFNAKSVGLERRHPQHSKCKQKKDDPSCDLAARTFIQNEGALGDLSESDMWVLGTSHLDINRIAIELDELSKFCGVVEFILVVDSAAARDVPIIDLTLSFRIFAVIKEEAYLGDLVVV